MAKVIIDNALSYIHNKENFISSNLLHEVTQSRINFIIVHYIMSNFGNDLWYDRNKCLEFWCKVFHCGMKYLEKKLKGDEFDMEMILEFSEVKDCINAMKVDTSFNSELNEILKTYYREMFSINVDNAIGWIDSFFCNMQNCIANVKDEFPELLFSKKEIIETWNEFIKKIQREFEIQIK